MFSFLKKKKTNDFPSPLPFLYVPMCLKCPHLCPGGSAAVAALGQDRQEGASWAP